MESMSESTTPDDRSCASPPGEVRNIDGEMPMKQASSTHNPKLLEELEKSSNLASAWYKIRFELKDSGGEFREIETRVDSGSGYSIMDSSVVAFLGLEKLQTRHGIPLKGIFGRKKVAIYYVAATIACPVIGLEPDDYAVLVVEDKTIEGQLILGTKFIEKHEIFEKIREARKKHGNLPPGVTVESLDMDEDNVIRGILDGRSRSMKKKDEEKYKHGQVETASALADMFHVKGLPSSNAVTPGAGGSSNPSFSRTSTWGSTVSVFSGVESIASTAATTVSSNSVAIEVPDKGKSS